MGCEDDVVYVVDCYVFVDFIWGEFGWYDVLIWVVDEDVELVIVVFDYFGYFFDLLLVVLCCFFLVSVNIGVKG